MKTKTLLAGALTALLLLTGLALGQAGLNPNGRPAAKAGDYLGYLVWRDDNGWHVRWSTAKVVRGFSGSIQAIGGTFLDAKGVGLESKTDHLSISPGLIKYSAKAAQHQDGIDFKLSPKTKLVRFELLIDGKPERERVIVGRGKQRPPSIPFEISP